MQDADGGASMHQLKCILTHKYYCSVKLDENDQTFYFPFFPLNFVSSDTHRTARVRTLDAQNGIGSKQRRPRTVHVPKRHLLRYGTESERRTPRTKHAADGAHSGLLTSQTARIPER